MALKNFNSLRIKLVIYQNLSSNVKSFVEYLFINICVNTVVYKHIKLS